jgi:RHS repeat-associated protein
MAHRPGGGTGPNSWTRNYTYFATNNRLDKTSVPGSPLDLSDTYTYDAHGSMTSMPTLEVMEWDYADRLKHTRPVDGANPQDTFYTYDGAGQRVRKVFTHMGTLKERIYLGGYEIYRERPNTTGSTVAFERETLHVMDDQRRVAMVETKTREGGAPVTPLVSRWRFQLDNHLGSATIELDEAGDVISYEEYHPYGSTAFNAAKSAVQVSAKRYRYTGKERDEETGLYYHGARYYAPWLGRWTATDPKGDVDGPALYNYCRGNPISLVDTEGKQAGTPHPAPAPGPARPDPGPPPGVTPEEYAQSQRRVEERRQAIVRQERAAFEKGRVLGEAYGRLEADVEYYLDIVKKANLTPEERQAEVNNILASLQQLPQPEEIEDAGLAEHYQAGIASGFGASYLAASAFITATVLAVEYLKTRNLRLPSLKWGRWAGTAGNSKFLFNQAAIAKFGLDQAKWIRFTQGKADFSAVALKIEGKASIRVAGLTGDRNADRIKVIEEVSKQLGKSKRDVETLIAQQRLRIHHYKDDLIQLVPKKYHQFGHQGTVKDLRELAALGGAGAGVYVLLADLLEGK